MEPKPSTAPRRAHPELPELAGGLRLSVESLRQRQDASKLEGFIQMLANAEYWLSFELHDFEPVLATAPSPLRELGVAIALKFSDEVDGGLRSDDVMRAQQFLIRRVAPDMRPGLSEALDRLQAVVQTRDRQPTWSNEGFTPYKPEPALSVHALRARGQATIIVDGDSEAPDRLEFAIGQMVRLSSVDEKGRGLSPPEIETDTGAPLLVRKADGARDVVFTVPGRYRLRVPGRASGDKKALVL